MMFFDSHCHLDFAAFDEDRWQVLQRCDERAVRHILLPGVTADGWSGLLELLPSAENHNISLVAALGMHPMFMAQHEPAPHLDRLQQLLRTANQRVVAVGEIGLDYMLEEASWSAQQALFIEQLKLAKAFDLPVVLHVRKSHDQILKLIRQAHFPRGGIVHAFSGSEQQARRYIEFGFYLGVGGAFSWPRATRLRALLQRLPVEHLVLETDAPDMLPAFVAGRRNSPEYLPDIAHLLAELKGVKVEAIAQATTANAQKLFYGRS